MFQTGKKNVQRKSGMTTEQFFFSFFLVFCHLSVGHLKRVKFFIFFPSLFDCRLVFFFWVYNQKVVHTVHIRARLLLEINMDDNLKKVNYIWGFIFINDLSINRVVVDN